MLHFCRISFILISSFSGCFATLLTLMLFLPLLLLCSNTSFSCLTTPTYTHTHSPLCHKFTVYKTGPLPSLLCQLLSPLTSITMKRIRSLVPQHIIFIHHCIWHPSRWLTASSGYICLASIVVPPGKKNTIVSQHYLVRHPRCRPYVRESPLEWKG